MVDVITIGGATRDFFFEIDQLKSSWPDKEKVEKILEIPYGEKIVADKAFYSFGGGAVNTAISFSRLGLKSASICKVGKDGSGRLIRESLKREKVVSSFVIEDSVLHTGLSVFILGKDAEHTGFLERGANNNLVINKWTPLKKTKWFYLSSLTGASAELLPKIFDFAARNKIKVAFNPGSAQLSLGYRYLKGFIEATEVLLLNYEEAEGLFISKNKKVPKSEEDLLVGLSKMGAKIVVVTMDGVGSRAISDGKIYRQRAFSEKVVDTTGAGDSFGSTFVFGVIKGYDIRYSLKIAAINAGSVVNKMGATDGLLSYYSIKRSKWL